VQCTRCGLVFTAHRPGDEAAGSGPSGASPTPATGTLPFGSAARPGGPIRTEAYGQGGTPSAGATQVFGQGPVRAPPPAAPSAGAARTQVFGAGGSEAARTQMFGGSAPGRSPAPAQPGQEVPPGRTQVFGQGNAAPPRPGSDASAPPRTQMFGAGEASGGQAGQRTPALGRAGADPSTVQAGQRTQMFGGAAAERSDPSAGRTQMFGGAGAGAPPEAGAARGAPRTQASGASDGAAQEARIDLPAIADESLRGTKLFGHVIGTGVELPEDEPNPLGLSPAARPYRPDASERALAEAIRRRNRRGLLSVFGLIVLAGLAWGARSWLAMRNQIPTPARAERDAAFALLRRDDPRARADALKKLEGLIAKYPGWVAARSTQALALTLELDDQRAIVRRALADADQVSTQLARLEAEHQPSDWRAQADAARLRLKQLKQQTDPLIDAANALETRVNASRDALNKLPQGSAEDELARLRADAVFAGVAGRDRAVEYAERYRQMGGKDGWADVAYAEYALSTRVAPETTQQALNGVKTLVAHDSTFLRPYVLAGRLALQQRQRDAALAQFDAVLALNPRHVLAQTLADQERNR
jgi:hypothetical protein